MELSKIQIELIFQQGELRGMDRSLQIQTGKPLTTESFEEVYLKLLEDVISRS